MPDLNWKLHKPTAPAAPPEDFLEPKPLALSMWEDMSANVGKRFMVRGFRPDWIKRELAPYADRFLGNGRSAEYVLEVEEHQSTADDQRPGVLVGLRPFVVPPGWTWAE